MQKRLNSIDPTLKASMTGFVLFLRSMWFDSKQCRYHIKRLSSGLDDKAAATMANPITLFIVEPQALWMKK